jgi:AraC family transcriptional regulator
VLAQDKHLEPIVFAQTGLRISRYQPHTAMPPHQHDDASLNIVVAGDFLERIGKDERIYTRGTAAFCPAATTHSQEFGATGVRQIIFKPHDSWLDYLADCKARLDEAPHSYSSTFRDLGDRLLEEMLQGDGFCALACEGIMLEIVAAFGRKRAAAAVHTKPPTWLRTACEFMHENAFVSLTMAQIAREAGRHEIHLAREFRRFFGMSVGAYLRRLRTDQAQRLLLKPQMSISEIAQSCGFASHSHLCREFKAHFGITPSEYRARNR